MLPRSLSTRIVIPLLLGTLATALAGSWLTYATLIKQFEIQLLQRGSLLANTINQSARVATKLPDLRIVIHEIATEEPGIRAISVATRNPFSIWASNIAPDQDRSILTRHMLTTLIAAIENREFGYRIEDDESLTLILPLEPAASDLAGESFDVAQLAGAQDHRSFVQSPDIGDHRYIRVAPENFRGAIYLSLDWSKLKQASTAMIGRLILIFIIGIALTILFAYYLVRRNVLEPLGAIRTSMHQQERGHKSVRVPAIPVSELDDVGQTLNNMLDALHLSQQQFEALFESIPAAVLIKDIEGRYVVANTTWHRWFNPENRDIKGKVITDFFTPEHAVEVSEQDRQVAETGHIVKIETQTPFADGSARTTILHKFPIIDPEGNTIAIGGINLDISDRKQMEQELARHRDNLQLRVDNRTQELREAHGELIRKERLAALGQLTATVSHELRNPLAAMRPSLYVMEKRLSKDADEKLLRAFDRMDRSIDRCDRIIDELLDLTRITNLEMHKIELDEWLGTMIAEQDIDEDIQLQEKFGLQGIELEVDVDRLRRALINVIENACQAMQDDRKQVIDKQNAYLKIETRLQGGRAEIRISDIGKGMSEELQEKIFEPLFSTKAFGVGLGMPTVKQIMEQHGGGIEIDSMEGEGSTVTLWLPYA